jgi:glycosyltransferase involved in cell wall biosynthesis
MGHRGRRGSGLWSRGIVRIEVVTPDADPDRGGFGARVHMILLMLSRFAETRCLLTSWRRHPVLDEVEYIFSPLPRSPLERLRLLRTFYSTRRPLRPDWPRPDLLLVESLDFLAAAKNLPDVPVVLDEHNVYWDLQKYDLLNREFFRSGIGSRASIQRVLAPGLLRRAFRFEAKAIRRVDGVLVTSEGDRDTIVDRIPEAAPKVHVVPNCVDATRFRPGPPEQETAAVLFTGNFNYVPNREAAEVIASTLAPALPLIPFLLVGKDLPPDMPLPNNVVAMGHVDDISPLLVKTGVCIAPLLHGSGTRIKILTYLAAGKAVVATTKACEGLDVVNERHLLIRDDWTGFVAGTLRLLGDPVWRLDLGRAGRKLVEQKYDWRAHGPSLRKALEAVARTK